MVVFGTRPEAIKLCPLVIALRKETARIKTVVCLTAQHREMLDQVTKVFDVRADYDLGLMKSNQSLFEITSSCLIETGKIIAYEKPDILLVQGDTTTALAASLAAYYHRVTVGHVEAGLRTYDKYSPFPEEINRRLVGVMADLHFAPTQINKKNLLLEGVLEDNILVTGNTVIDALLWVRDRIRLDDKTCYRELEDIDFSKKIILVTGHRREKFGQDFVEMCNALKELASNNRSIEIVYPVHLNPNVRQPVYSILSGIDNVKLIRPIGYEPFVCLMDRCHFIITDSGGIQEEAPSLGKPVIVTRDTTERPEAVEVGAAKLVGTDRRKIVNEAERLLTDQEHYAGMANVANPYGDGLASERILKRLLQTFACQE